MYTYKIPPRKPKDAIKVDDSYWKKASGVFAWEGNFWYVWFKTIPEVGDIVFDQRIAEIYHYRNFKKAIVKLESI